MLHTDTFLETLIENDYTHLCVVPCSFAKNLINSCLNNSDRISYIPCASEAVACSTAAGIKMSGKKPIVIVQSSGLTNMGSCITSLLKPYEITFPIIVSWRTYNKGDSEIQHQHLATELPKLIEAYGYKYELLNKLDIKESISTVNRANNSQIICVLESKTFSNVDLIEAPQNNYIKRSEYLNVLKSDEYKDYIFIGTTGNTAREMYHYMNNQNNFYMAGNMGGALSLGLGMALAGKKIIICGGDAEFVMHLGGLTTASRYKDIIDLTYIIFDNESNKSTGHQSTYQNHLDYIGILNANGINSCQDIIKDLSSFKDNLTKAISSKGFNALHVKCGFDDEAPRPPIEAVKRHSI